MSTEEETTRHTLTEALWGTLAELSLSCDSSPVTSSGEWGQVHEESPARDLASQAAELMRLAQHWLLAGNPTAGQVAERVVVDRRCTTGDG
ncbi:hypothetical protein QQF64_017314 [Cirrhinus molitorella]|uniref:Uncharacterized protein n=1 Tax=Cirrhinus molitorella TaxID=172907 RepID=A0ABR3LIB0_9TELE